VVNAGKDATVREAAHTNPAISFIEMPADTLTPRLWSEGLAASRGSVVAFTTGHCFVSSEWGSRLLAPIATGAAGAGGPLRLVPHATLVDAAIFFLRYSAFIEGKPDGAVDDIAGDNAAYARGSIPPGTWTRENGFWERDVNRAIRHSGGSLAWVDGAVAGFGDSFRFGSICRHRFEHGRLFGHARVANDGESCAKIVLGSVLVPIVLCLRAGRRTVGRAAYRGKFLVALPITMIIAACWAAGEAAGALEATIARRS
ncbi:MAG TPA: hypothetical protein VHM24_10615, partial [Gemmatimonadaceae bacterium]|nr:hypothetical protein [Gemmatimonadaceae bacterium]